MIEEDTIKGFDNSEGTVVINKVTFGAANVESDLSRLINRVARLEHATNEVPAFELRLENLERKLCVENSFQSRVGKWVEECFGKQNALSTVQRNYRFLEEALELVQSLGCTKHEALQLVDYVYGRAVGEPKQEAGGVMITLAALCVAYNLDMNKCGEDLLLDAWRNIEKVREKNKTKPKISQLP